MRQDLAIIKNPQRRALLLAASALLLSGCKPGWATETPSTPPPTARSVPRPPTAAPVPDVSRSPTPPDSASTASRTVPSQDQIAGVFAGRLPTYWGLRAPNVLQILPDPAAGIALTLDFCGGPGGSGTDHAALDMLKRLGVPATLFLNARWIHANQALARQLAGEPLFELANHGTGHAPLSVTGNSAYGIPGTRSSGQVYEEIMSNDRLLTEITGKRPRFFRPGTAFLDEVASEICLALGVIPTGFSINADAGATYPADVVAAETAQAQPGDIIISHGNRPGSGTATGLAAAIPALLNGGYSFTTLGAALPWPAPPR